MPVSNQPQCWCSEHCAMGWFMVDCNSVYFCHVYFQYMMQIVIMKPCRQAPQDTAFTCSHFHFLSLLLPSFALGNVNVSPCPSPWYFLYVYLYASLVRRCEHSCGGVIYTAVLMPVNLCRMQSEGRAKQIDRSKTCLGFCVLAWPGWTCFFSGEHALYTVWILQCVRIM